MNPINLNFIQDDIFAYLQSDPFFANIFLYELKPANLQSQVNKALAGLQMTNGKSGAAVEIGKPWMVNPLPNAPGPRCEISARFIIKTQPTINLGPNGTGIATEQISLHLVQALLEWGAEGSQSGSWFCSNNFDAPAQFGQDAPFEGRIVDMRAMFAATPLVRTTTPSISGGGGSGNAVITVPTPDTVTAAIIFTTDGTCPGFIQGQSPVLAPGGYPIYPNAFLGTTQSYAGPFAAPVGTVIRAMALTPGKLPSIVNYSLVTS
jgi:hypothetical protein